ncbi:hypothetical protein JXA70_11260 [candidate division KSB1 bacterium]|nr:hypothetical protein [candidate division KSB1 bacterium]
MEISIYNMTRRQVRSLLSGLQKAGQHSLCWDGTPQASQTLPSSVYILSISAGAYRASSELQ